jgi:hypothetical protein
MQVSLIYALGGSEWLVSCLCCFTSRERAPGSHWIGNWMGLRAGLDDTEKRKFFILPRLELRPFGRLARSQPLYWLRYLTSHMYICMYVMYVYRCVCNKTHYVIYGGHQKQKTNFIGCLETRLIYNPYAKRICLRHYPPIFFIT